VLDYAWRAITYKIYVANAPLSISIERKRFAAYALSIQQYDIDLLILIDINRLKTYMKQRIEITQ